MSDLTCISTDRLLFLILSLFVLSGLFSIYFIHWIYKRFIEGKND